jgi:hypothetical protein
MKNLFTTILLLIVSIAGVFAQSSKGAQGPNATSRDVLAPKAVQRIQKTGGIKVDAWKSGGVMFKNETNDTMVYTFMVSKNDRWYYSGYSATYVAGGVENKSVTNLTYGPYVGALIVLKENGKYKMMDQTGVMNVGLMPGETIRFVMNDTKGGYGDNTGSIIVNWKITEMR